MSLNDILAKAKPASKTITLFLNGEHQARIDGLVQQLNVLGTGESLAGNPQRAAIETEIDEALDAAKQFEQEFTFQAMGAGTWNRLIAQYPPGDMLHAWDPVKFPIAAVSMSLVDPKLNEDETSQLHDRVSPGIWNRLVAACMNVNNETGDIPKSVRRSDGTQSSEL